MVLGTTIKAAKLEILLLSIIIDLHQPEFTGLLH